LINKLKSFFQSSRKNNTSLMLYCILIIPFISLSQNESESKLIDSLSRLGYNILKKNIRTSDSIISNSSISAYLIKSKKEKDTANIIYGYRRFLYTKKKINYYDSIIYLLKNSNNKKFYEPLSTTYFGKGSYYYSKYEFNKSLDYFLKANKLLPGVDIDMNIGLIRMRTGEYEEALKTFQKIKNENLKISDKSDALWLYFAFAETHRHLKNWDSASFYISLGHKEVIRTKVFERKAYFSLLQGANSYGLKKYKQSIDTMVAISKKFIKNGDQANLMFNYYFTGISGYKSGRKQLSLKYFKKLDSIYLLTNHIEPEFRKAYEILINEALKRNDVNNQLKYVNRLLYIDSTLNKEYKFLSKNIYQKYDSPKLLAEKQKIINRINKEKTTSYAFLKYALISIFLLTLTLLYFFYLNKKNKKRFEALLKGNKLSLNEKPSKIKSDKITNLNINQDVIDNILEKIKTFEKSQKFLNKDISLNNLAKEFETNSKYLSQIINHYRGNSFSNYINTLRINYAVNELKTNKLYIKYTIKAISNEFGFNSSESFSAAFYKNTGLKPSYFIKELRK